jgi:hypothetical protein
MKKIDFDSTSVCIKESGFTLPPFDDPKYRKELDGDLTEEQIIQILKALDTVMRICVDIGFGVDAVQLAIPALAEFNKQSESLADFSGMEESGDDKIGNQRTNFNSAATEGPQKE